MYTLLSTLSNRDAKYDNLSYEDICKFLTQNKYNLWGWSIRRGIECSSAEYFMRYKTELPI